MDYRPRLTVANTPSRLTRKQSRRSIYLVNRKMKALQRKAKREAR